MFTFGSEVDSVFTLVQNKKGHVYTWATLKDANEYFETAQCETSMYRVDPDLCMAHLVTGDGPAEVYLDDDQKTSLFKSYIYPSLLAWTP